MSLPAPTRRLLGLRVGVDDDLARAAPPPSFPHPEDLAALMTGAHSVG